MPPSASLRWRLRDATAAAHARIDSQVGDAVADVAGYAAFLRGMHGFVRHARQVLGDADDLVACERALADDLQVLGHAPVDVDLDGRATREMARLGWRYVIAGSSLGARLLLRRAEALGFTGTHGARYLALHAGGDAWRTLLSTLDALRLSPADEARACEGANDAFQCVEQCLDAARSGLAV
ncbi:MAG TPA: biliverdin-producing heme oxygenase [Lysobacter sp.]